MIDWGRVKELRAEIGAESLGEVVELFLEEADEVVDRVTADNGAKALESDLHFLKGSALNLGFADLAALCQEGERSAAAGNTRVDLDRVRSVYAASKQMFALGLATSSAA